MASLKGKAYEIIKSNIISCRYQPGQFLNEAQLMEEIGVSRTPIREALSKLEQEQYLRILPKKGIVVREITLKEISDLYQVRVLLEPQIVLRWGGAIPLEGLEDCRAKLLGYRPEMDLAQRNELDDCMHRLIIDTCPNAYLRQWLGHAYTQIERIRVYTGQIGQYMERNNADHLAIIERLLLADYAEAARLLCEHFESAKRTTIDTLLSMRK